MVRLCYQTKTKADEGVGPRTRGSAPRREFWMVGNPCKHARPADYSLGLGGGSSRAVTVS